MALFEHLTSGNPQADLPQDRITLTELERAIRTSDPKARLVRPRILRRIIKLDRGLTGFAFRVPHRKSYVIDGRALLSYVEPEEVGASAAEALPDKLILLTQPNPQKLLEMSAADALIATWRLLFHASVHVAIQQRIAERKLDPAALSEQIHKIGEVEFEEARAVLGQEGFLLPPQTDMAVYEEFAAVFFELRYFAPNALPRYFPAIEDLDVAADTLRRDVDAQWLFLTTRPLNAPDPVDSTSAEDHGPSFSDVDKGPLPPAAARQSPSRSRYTRLMRQARRPLSLGNIVGAAIYHLKALNCAPPERIEPTRALLKDDLKRLIARLEAALELDAPGPQPWHDALRRLLQFTADGFWTAEARLLYDLQKVCVAHEREISKINLFRWLASLGRKSIKQPLHNQRDVLVTQHLRSAERRLPAVRLRDADRKHLTFMIRTALEKVEQRLRDEFRPRIAGALESVGLRPENLPERVARKKIVEELLDRVAERGFISFGNLRDALSRNALKLPDIADPRTLVFGDELLQADRRLASALEGVYRPSEFYLRWMQQLSSLAFGTRIGRFLTLNAAVPFGGAYLVYMGLNHLAGIFLEDIHHYENPSTILMLGVFIFGLVNALWFRKLVGRSLKDAYYCTKKNVVIPLWRAIQSHVVQVVINSLPFRLLLRLLIKPLVWTALAWMVFPLVGVNLVASLSGAAAIFVVFMIFLNVRVGRNIEEMIADWAVQAWHRYGMRFFMGLFWIVVDFFNGVLQAIERMMYSVDEWLRFRSGETALALWSKAGLGALWALAAYVLRFCVTLLIEPQINPIKHFPVVTVSHKLLVGLIPHLAWILESRMGIEKGWAWTLASAVIFSIPGVFGFLVWELKENWRLYAANRKKNLSPVVIGGHGETMVRLLKPGLHSGTLPKLFAKLRRAERKARAGGKWRGVRKYLHALERFEISLRRYIEREVLALLAETRVPALAGIKAREIRLATNRVEILFGNGQSADGSLLVALASLKGWLVGDVASAGWAGRLPENQRQAVVLALVGLYKTAALDLVCQQIQSALRPRHAAYQIDERGIIVYPGLCDSDGSEKSLVSRHSERSGGAAPRRRSDTLPRACKHAPCASERSEESAQAAIIYDLIENTVRISRPAPFNALPDVPALDRRGLVFSDLPIAWDQWVLWWEAYQSLPEAMLPEIVSFPVLPKN